MSLAEVLPLVKELSYTDEFLLLHLLTSELLRDAGLTPLETQSNLSSLALYDSFEAAAILTRHWLTSKQQSRVDKARFAFTHKSLYI
jgi:hypothetical protein